MVNILIMPHVEWKINARTDKWTIAVSVIEQILQHMMDNSINIYNSINNATIFMNAARDKRVMQ